MTPREGRGKCRSRVLKLNEIVKVLQESIRLIFSSRDEPEAPPSLRFTLRGDKNLNSLIRKRERERD